jgi:hypothetical protein
MSALLTRVFLLFHWLHEAAINERRAHRNWRAIAYGVVAGVCAALRIAGILFATVALVAIGAWWIALPIVVIAGGRSVAPVVIRYVTVPAGHIRVTYWLGRLHKMGAQDSHGYALVVGAWAAQYASLVGAGGVARDWLTQRCDQRGKLGDCEIATHGLLTASVGGSTSQARAIELLTSIELTVEKHMAIREVVAEYLAVAAADRNDWQSLIDFNAPAWPASPLRFLLEGIAQRKIAMNAAPRSAISGLALWSRWLMAPHRRVTFRVVQAALATNIKAGESDAVAEVVDAPTPSHVAVAALAGLTRQSDSSTLQSTAALWHQALSASETCQWIEARHQALGISGPASVTAGSLTSSVADALAMIARQHSLSAPTLPAGNLASEMSRRLRHGTLDTLDSDFLHWAEHCDAQSTTPLIVQWRTFVALKSAYESAAAIGGLSLQRLAFSKVFAAGNRVAVVWWNQRSEYVASHAISSWLLRQALHVGDAQAIELGRKNCSLAVQTRTGVVRG